ncbi:MAG: glycosyltransferase family 2 protein [Tractidigestivibacter sp.]|uniref:glycosyltransferase family 2 protein n=1 Tax=Tractidigestivibacter sp. TaxID=2847320 RepID=UPI003D90544B
MPYDGRTSPLVSVIIVSNNSAATIRRAIESIQSQSIKDHETIVVDDGSRDGTMRLVESMAERDLTISLYRTDGAGVAAAMDLGISHARGKYLMFFDADGWSDASMLADLVEPAEKSKLELVMSGFSIVSDSGDKRRVSEKTVNQPQRLYATQQDFRAEAWQLFEANQLSVPCAKLFLRDRVEQLSLRFSSEEGDKLPFVLGYLYDVSRVGVTGQVHYHVADSSAFAKFGFFTSDYQSLERSYGRLVDLYHHWGLDGDAASMGMIQSRYFECLVDCIMNVCSNRSGLSPSERRRVVREIVASDRAQLAANVARPRGVGAKAMQAPIKSGNADLAYTEGYLAALVRRGPSAPPFCAML